MRRHFGGKRIISWKGLKNSIALIWFVSKEIPRIFMANSKTRDRERYVKYYNLIKQSEVLWQNSYKNEAIKIFFLLLYQ